MRLASGLKQGRAWFQDMCYHGGLLCVLPPLVEIGVAFLLSFGLFTLLHGPCRRASSKARAEFAPEAKCEGSSPPRELAAESRRKQPGRRESSVSSLAEEAERVPHSTGRFRGVPHSRGSFSSSDSNIASQMNSRQMPPGLRRSMSDMGFRQVNPQRVRTAAKPAGACAAT